MNKIKVSELQGAALSTSLLLKKRMMNYKRSLSFLHLKVKCTAIQTTLLTGKRVLFYTKLLTMSEYFYSLEEACWLAVKAVQWADRGTWFCLCTQLQDEENS